MGVPLIARWKTRHLEAPGMKGGGRTSPVRPVNASAGAPAGAKNLSASVEGLTGRPHPADGGLLPAVGLWSGSPSLLSPPTPTGRRCFLCRSVKTFN